LLYLQFHAGAGPTQTFYNDLALKLMNSWPVNACESEIAKPRMPIESSSSAPVYQPQAHRGLRLLGQTVARAIMDSKRIPITMLISCLIILTK